jgi:hypothetical protein
MPLLYGEGQKAFIRLQEEIIKRTDDQSIFAWIPKGKHSSPIAESPSWFRHCGNVTRFPLFTPSTPFSLTHMGLKIRLPTIVFKMHVYLALLACREEATGDVIANYLQPGSEKGHYTRVSLEGRYLEYTEEGTFNILYNREALNRSMHGVKLLLRPLFHQSHLLDSNHLLYGFWFGSVSFRDHDVNNIDDSSTVNMDGISIRGRIWDPNTRLLELPEAFSGTVGTIVFRPSARTDMKPMVVDLGFAWDFSPVCRIRLLHQTSANDDRQNTQSCDIEAIADEQWAMTSSSEWLTTDYPAGWLKSGYWTSWDKESPDPRQYNVLSKYTDGMYLFQVTGASRGVAVIPQLALIFILHKARIGPCKHNKRECDRYPKHYGWQLFIQNQHWKGCT